MKNENQERLVKTPSEPRTLNPRLTGWAALSVAVAIGLAGFVRAAEPWVWNGGDAAAPTAWEVPGNWTGNAAPAAGEKRDAEIPAGCTHYPVVTNGVVLGGKLIVATCPAEVETLARLAPARASDKRWFPTAAAGRVCRELPASWC